MKLKERVNKMLNIVDKSEINAKTSSSSQSSSPQAMFQNSAISTNLLESFNAKSTETVDVASSVKPKRAKRPKPQQIANKKSKR